MLALRKTFLPNGVVFSAFQGFVGIQKSHFRCDFIGDGYRISLLAAVLQCWRLEQEFLLQWCNVLCVSGGSLALKSKIFAAVL